MIIVDIVPCSNNDRFSLVNKLLLQNCAKKNSNEEKQSQAFSNESTVMPVSITILWCPVDIRDYEQGHVTKRVRVCMRVRARVRSVTLCCSSC